MARRNATLTFPLCASLTIHALLLITAAWWYVRSTPLPKLPALERPERGPIILAAAPTKPPETPPPAQKPAATLPPPRKPPEKDEDFSEVKPVPRDDSGETEGKGTANRSTDGNRPMQAAPGPEQANLSRATENKSDEKIDDRSPLAAQTGAAIGSDAPAASATPAFGVAQPSMTPASSAARQPMIAIADPTHSAMTPSQTDTPAQVNQLGQLNAPHESARPPVPLVPKINQAVTGHVTQKSDSDSDAFSHASSATFHDGKMDARQGRKVRTVRPEYGLSAEADFSALANPTVVLGATVDASGTVTNVVVIHSSGSDNIDLPTIRAVYEWWFEPLKDKNHQPLPDRWVVTIN